MSVLEYKLLSSIDESIDYLKLKPEKCLFLGVITPSSSCMEWILLLILLSISVTPIVISPSYKVELLRFLGEGVGLLSCLEA